VVVDIEIRVLAYLTGETGDSSVTKFYVADLELFKPRQVGPQFLKIGCERRKRVSLPLRPDEVDKIVAEPSPRLPREVGNLRAVGSSMDATQASLGITRIGVGSVAALLGIAG
jgi:hypothetical protein